MAIERRLNPRIDISGSASLTVVGQTVSVNLLNINLQGVQIEMVQTTFALLSSKRADDGRYPVSRMTFSEAVENSSQQSMVDCELIFSRRLDQKTYVGGFKFIAADQAASDTIRALLLKFAKQ